MAEKRKTKRMDLESTLIIKRLDNTIGETVAIEILDVSKNGVGFQCSKLLEIGSVYEGHLTIWTKETIHTFVEVVRVKKVESFYVYGGHFVGMTEQEAQRISIYEAFSSEN